MKIISKEEYLVGVTNSVKKLHPNERVAAKAPTFALQYLGTPFTLQKKCGFSKEQAEQIYNAYHDLYKVTGEFNQANADFMAEHGFIECAFGLHLRTPIVKQCIIGNSSTPSEAAAEIRSGNNAVTQSWGMLLLRACNAYEEEIIADKMENDILISDQIHDAGYYLVRNTVEAVKHLNDKFIKQMQWNDHPLIKNDDVPMEAELDIGRSWLNKKTLKNNLTEEEIQDALESIDIFTDE